MYFNFQNEDALTPRFSLARVGRIVGRRRQPRERTAGQKDCGAARAGKIVGRRCPRERVVGQKDCRAAPPAKEEGHRPEGL